MNIILWYMVLSADHAPATEAPPDHTGAVIVLGILAAALLLAGARESLKKPDRYGL